MKRRFLEILRKDPEKRLLLFYLVTIQNSPKISKQIRYASSKKMLILFVR